MNQKRRELQTARMWRYFLDAASELITEKGLNSITIREIADRAGYTSSTVYNYFKDLSHLKFFAVMRFTYDYVQALPQYMEKGDNTVEKWLYSWECFCLYSFKNPDIYSLLYIEKLGMKPDEVMQNYYKVFANDLVGLSDDVQDILRHHSISKRSAMYIQTAIDEGFMNEEDVEYLADTTMLIWNAMITNYINMRNDYSEAEVIARTMDYITKTIMNTIPSHKRSEIKYAYKSK